MHQNRDQRGFTLIELLIVIGIIGFLAAAVLVAVDPVKRIQDSRDAKRYSEVNAVLNAILTKQVDDRALHNGCCDTGGAPIVTQSGSSVQVIVTSDVGIVCNAQATRPGCNKAMDTSGANKNCVALIGTNVFAGAGTAVSSTNSVTGTSTNFDPEVEVGDTLTFSGGGTCVVATRTSDVNITCNANVTPAAAGDTFTVTSADDTAVVPGYIASIPTDPRGTGTPCGTGSGCTTLGDLALGATNTGYYLARTTGNRIEIGSCAPEQATSISVKR